MSNVPPFGFGLPSGGGGEEPDPANPFGAMFGAGGPGGQMDIGAAFTRLGQLLSWTGGPVNWDLARDMARQTVAASNDRYVGDAARAAVEEALRLAELWLDDATALPAASYRAAAWSRADWVEQTLPAWQPLVEPVAGRVVEAMGGALGSQVPPEMQGMAGPLGQMKAMMQSVGGAMFGAQVGQALGSLAGEVVGSTDIGLPLAPAGRAALLPANVAGFGGGLDVPEDQVRLFLALREAAHQRLYAHAPWLRDRLVTEITRYAQGITIDTARIEEAVSRIDPTNPEAMQEALTGGLFEPQHTPEQQRVLTRLEGLLALVEGWVDEVVAAAAGSHLPAAAALRETVRRRRATGGPAEQTFASLVGLELRPRRLRDAASLWRAVAEARGMQGRDAIWDHPDYLPGAEDLDDPAGFAAAATGDFDLSGLDQPGGGGRAEGTDGAGTDGAGDENPGGTGPR